jgi:hypothetical protein
MEAKCVQKRENSMRPPPGGVECAVKRTKSCSSDSAKQRPRPKNCRRAPRNVSIAIVADPPACLRNTRASSCASTLRLRDSREANSVGSVVAGLVVPDRNGGATTSTTAAANMAAAKG